MNRIINHAYYTGENEAPLKFAFEMQTCGLQAAVKAEDGCLEYDYYAALDGSEKVILVEGWKDAECLESHMNGEVMQKIRDLKAKYGLETKLEIYKDCRIDS